MCTYSMITDDWSKRIPGQYPWMQPIISPVNPIGPFPPNGTRPFIGVDKEEFLSLKREVEELRELLKAAKRYDANTGQPDCEADDKVALLRRVADALSIDLSDALPDAPEAA